MGVRRATPRRAQKFIVANGDEGDPGSYIDKVLMERQPAAAPRGHGARRLRGRRRARLRPRALASTRAPSRRSRPAVERARRGLLGDDILGSGFAFDVTVVEGAGSYVVGEETALLRCLQGLRGTVSARPPFPAERGVHGLPTVVNNVETLCNIPFIAAHGADAYRALSPGATPGTKLVCFNERFARPGVYEVPFGMTRRASSARTSPAACATAARSRRCRSAGRSAGSCPRRCSTRRFDFEELAADGCMVGHGGIVAFDDGTDMRASPSTCCTSAPPRAAASASRAASACAARTRCSPTARRSTARELEELLETLELGRLCAHGGGMPAPIRSLLAHFPEELGLA